MSRTVRYRDHGKGFNTPEPAAGYDGSFTDDWYVGDRRRDIADAERRAERLTGSATASVGGQAGGVARSAREELEDVAAALERLVPGLSDEKRNDRDGGRRAGGARDTDARAGRIESVLRALDRLDRRVEDLSGRGEEEDIPPAARQKPLPREPRPHEGAGVPRPADVPAFDTREPMAVRGPARMSGEKYGDDDVKPLLREISDKMDRLGGPQEEHLSCMRREIESLREALKTRDSQTDTSGGQDFRRLASAVEGLKSERGDNRLVYALRNEIADLRASLNRSNVEGLLKSLESGYAHLVERLDDLSRNSVDPSLLDGIGERLAEVENAFRMMPRAEQVETLDRHVHDIGKRLEVLAERSGGRDIEMLGQEVRSLRGIVESMDVGDLVTGIGDRLGEVTRRLDDVDGYLAEQRRFSERLTSMENRMPDAVAVDRLQERLEEITAMLAEDRSREEPSKFDEVDARFDDIVDRLERIEHARAAKSYDAAFTLLEKRLAAIDGKIDALEMPDLKAGRDAVAPTFDADVLSRLEEGIQRLNEKLDGDISADPSALGRIHEEIADLRRAVIEDRPGADLEARIRELAEAVGRGGANADDEALRNIEEKVARLSSVIDEAERRVSGMGNAGAGLAGGGQAGDALVEGLRGDLRRLLSAADQTDQRYRQETGDIQRLLSSINDRLAALEPAETFGRRSADVKSVDPEDDRPLEPGSGLPTLRNPPPTLEDPRVRKAAASPQEEARNRKADFIAAARRAAQAAAAEAAYEPQRSEPAEEGGEEGAAKKSWLKGRLSGIGRKKADPADETADQKDARNTENRKKIRAEIAASMAALRADAEPAKETAAAPEAPTAGDKPARAGAAPSSSRRRAILLAAAAVVIALGTLQVFRLVGPSGGEIAVNETPSPVAATTEAGDAPVETASVTLPQGAGEPPVTSTAATPPAQNPPAKRDVPANTSQAEAKVPEGEGPTVSAAPKTAQRTPEAGAQAAPPAAVNNSTDSLAFAPPSGLANAFGSSVPAIPPGRIEQRPANAASAGEAARAPAASGELPESIGPVSLRQAAEKGDPRALFEVAVRYSEGKGVSPDLAKAVKYYEEAAAGGLAPAQYRLGSLYEKGQGVEKNLETARLWYRRAADQGSAKATHNLAVLHAEGISGDPDFEVAADWFERAANYGVRDSQYNLGILYARGLGTEKNLTESYKWFALAAKQGDREAAKKRDEVANILTKAEMAEASLAVETWKPKPVNPAANEVASDPAWSTSAANVSEASLTEDPAEMVRRAQKMLATLGFDPGAADGQIGPRTRAAVSAFQKEAGLPVTGEIDGKLLRALLGRSI
ncbi:SEL1-like repeat protein [Rhizobiales bacterium]|uniref:peptidoglycan-binding protein n=1 Tax=Hongsoonwoonella zoysiae TaxID=2821844 RepID=UPI0015607091|nr:peptidoglycan-binding protein [Hongsoonwoonella zoysiae]NRG19609.1 SEL1-like repeat protein [Hongsoonwoonella zoysiae]